MPAKTSALKTVIKKFANAGAPGKSHQTLPDVAWRQRAIFVAQLAGRSAIVRHADQRVDVVRVISEPESTTKLPVPPPITAVRAELFHFIRRFPRRQAVLPRQLHNASD